MSNPFYTKTGNPQAQTRGLSSQIRNEFTLIEQGFDGVAPTNSPAFTGTPTAPLPSGSVSSQVATVQYVMSAALDANIPGQTGNAGKFLSTDGANPSWQSALKSSDIGSSVQGYDASTVKETSTQTLTNKTIAYASNTLTGVQPTLVSGTSIKTVNSTSLLGSGDVSVQPTLVSGTNIKTINGASILGSGNVVALSADVGFNTVGSFVFGFTNWGAIAEGSTLSGANLRPSGISTSGASENGVRTDRGALSGTWRCLGYADGSAATLWQRIS